MTTTFDIINAILNKDDDTLFNLPSDTSYWLLHKALYYSINTLNLELFNNLVEKGAKLDDNEVSPILKLLFEKGNEEWLDTFVSFSLKQIPERDEPHLIDMIVGASIKYNKLDVLKKWYPKLSLSNNNVNVEFEMYIHVIKNENIEIIKWIVPKLNDIQVRKLVQDRNLKNISVEIVDFLINNVLQRLQHQINVYEHQEYYHIIQLAVDKNLDIIPIVNKLEKHGFIMNQTDLNGYLIASISNKNLTNVEYFISKGADVNEGFHKLISYAIDTRCPDIVQLLLSHGANVTKHIFLSALYKYMENLTDDSRQIVRLLLDNVDEESLTNTNSGDDYWDKNLRL